MIIRSMSTIVKRLYCDYGQYHDRIGEATSSGILLWCREHKQGHLVTWEELALLQQSFQPISLESKREKRA